MDAIGQSGGCRCDGAWNLNERRQNRRLAGLREYVVVKRRQDFVRQFCRKLLGFALGRSVQLSDLTLLDAMQKALEANHYACHEAVMVVVTSEAFLSIRGETMDNGQR